MRRFLFLLLALLMVIRVDGYLVCDALYDCQGGLSEALLEVLEAFWISHDGSWETIVHETQNQWLKDQNEERWEYDPCEDHDVEKTYALFSNLSMAQSFCSQDWNYEYGVILGATVQVIRQRFWFLKQEWDRGVRFKRLIFLTGDRPLAPAIENEAELIDPNRSSYPFRKGWRFGGGLPTNETEMMKLVFDQLDLPEKWRSLPVLFVDTPCPEGHRRPHTSDTFMHWLSMKPKPAATLIVSSQPFIVD